MPHYPFRTQNYIHVATEIWQRTVAGQETYTVCNGGEDNSCSQSIGMLQWDLADHLSALGVAKVDC